MVGKLAYIFPGQGAQYVGMGKKLYDKFAVSKQIFDKADNVLGFSLSQLCFEGPQEELRKTKNCQLAILVTTVATLGALTETNKNLKCSFTAGLSLGEYSALVAAGVISFEEVLFLVKKRAGFMADAAEKKPGKMLAVIGLDQDLVVDLCRQADIEIANRNCPGQIVVTGIKQGIDKFADLANEKGAKRLIELDVNGAFHSRLMNHASLSLERELEIIEFSSFSVPTISNVTAKPFGSIDQLRKNLALQVKSSVLWEDSVRYMVSCGVKTFLEIGPGKVLKSLLRKIDSSLEVINIEKTEDIVNFTGV